MTKHLLLGQTLSYSGNPLTTPWEEVTHLNASGAVLVENGRIIATGAGTDLATEHPDAQVTDYGDNLILPGFVDAHTHYPQTAMIASWGKRLIDWLNDYTFPEEARFADPAYAQAVAGTYLDLLLDHGTTTVCTYCTTAPASVDAIFEAAEARGMRVLAGKTCMDRNAPEGLIDTAQRAYDESKSLLEKWHGRGRAGYVITPRFAPTSTEAQLEALGALWAEHPDCLMQTHISEQSEEIAWVKELFPGSKDYLDVYERFGLLGAKAVLGHAIHLEPREIARIKEVGAGLVHCPTSNTFIGSGLFDMGLAAQGVGVGLATDTGGGSSFSMLHTMAAAYEVAQLRGQALHPAQLIWLATEGSAATLHLSGQVGRLAPRAEADICVLDLASTPALVQRAANATGGWEAIFPTIMMGDDRAVADIWVAGQRRE
ncbi:MAG: guanine deaminase [Pseudomonadota bacterium]